jgi:hypothetical protein
VNWHEVIDARNLEMDRVVARQLRADPSKLRLVVARIERFLADPDYSVHSKDALTEWLAIIRQGVPAVLAALADESEEGQRRRQSSPFAILMPPDERSRILAEYEARRPRTHFAGV